MQVFPELGLDRRCRPRSGPRLPHFSFNERRRSGRGYFGGSRSHRGVCMACLEHWASTDRRRSKVMTSLDNFFAVFTRSNQADPTGALVYSNPANPISTWFHESAKSDPIRARRGSDFPLSGIPVFAGECASSLRFHCSFPSVSKSFICPVCVTLARVGFKSR